MTEYVSHPIENAPIIPVVKIEHLDDAVPLANALLEGGIDIIEVTLRTPIALKAIEKISKEVPQIRTGAGTIISKEHVSQCRDHGAIFGLSPGIHTDVLDEATRLDWPFVPGVATPSEIITAVNAGFHTLKFFPAELYGGQQALNGLQGPFPDVRFCPTGGVNIDNMKGYLTLESVCSIGGTWLTPQALMQEKKWDEISSLCREAVAVARQL